MGTRVGGLPKASPSSDAAGADDLVQRVDVRRLGSPSGTFDEIGGTAGSSGLDWVAVERPLEIRIRGISWCVLMRSPGNDVELVAGYLVSEGICGADRIERIAHSSIGEGADDVALVTLADDVELSRAASRRRSNASASCGLCGKVSAQHALALASAFEGAVEFPSRAARHALVSLRAEQAGFARCGGLHAVGLADEQGRLLVVREDVGRHNALDKVIGWAAGQGVSLGRCALVLSGRCSFEMVQKALAARCPTVVAIGAVSSLAVEVAQAAGMNLAGFAREGRMNLYAGELR